MKQLVLVRIPHIDKKVLALITREAFDDLPAAFGSKDAVAVYLPMSYRTGGYTLILPPTKWR